MSDLRDLQRAYSQGYFDGKQGKPANEAAWTDDELAQYRQGYAEGLATRHPDED